MSNVIPLHDITIQYNAKITITTANSRKSTYWVSQTLFWSEFLSKLKVPTRTAETFSQFKQMTKAEQDELKDVGGFVGGALIGHRRKAKAVQSRSLVTLDLDNIPAGGTEEALRRLGGLGCAYAVYSTRKHEPAKPRLRVIIPLYRPVSPDEYEPIARKVAELIGIEWCDPSTFEVHRLMYWPSCSADSEYVFHYADKPFLDPDGVLAMYRDWRNVAEWPQVPGAEKIPRRLATKQGDPLEKQGVVGAFCRVYDIHTAIEKFLPGVYVPASDDVPPSRYTYTGGSTTGGAVVYDDGRFLYSHHATDPCSQKLVNAFDLVRLHKFGDLDDEAKPDTPVSKLPSYQRMLEFALEDEAVAHLLNAEKIKEAREAFAAEVQAGSAPPEAEEEDYEWLKRLKLHPKTGKPESSTDNALIVLENDPWLRGRIAYDEFANRLMVMGSLPWDNRNERREWTDVDDAGLRHYLEKAYGITGERKVTDAVALCGHKHRYDEVKEYLLSLQWDGKKRLDTLFVDYLGAEDTAYVRAVARKSLVAAVARVMRPGCKYDYMPILAGPQGIGKSTLLKTLGRKWFSDSLQTFEGKEASELIQGVWIIEVGELAGMSKSEVNAVKQFLSKTEDIYRMPYGRRTQAFPRRCVFFGTTNNDEFLRDPTGNRRFWPVDVGIRQPSKSVFNDLPGEVDQIWAEAVTYWRLGEPLYLTGEVAEEATRQQERHRESDPREGMIAEFVEKPVPVDWQKWDIQRRRLYWSGGMQTDGVQTVARDRVCAAEIWVECLGGDLKHMKRTDVMAINAILDRLPSWKKSEKACRFGPYGVGRGYIKIV